MQRKRLKKDSNISISTSIILIYQLYITDTILVDMLHL